MRRIPCLRAALAALCLAAVLSGCAGVQQSAPPPESAADGSPWDASWYLHGRSLGVGVGVGDDFTPFKSDGILSTDGLWTSIWGVGEPMEDDDSGEAQFPAQVYVLVKECADADEARAAVDEWGARLEETWRVTDTREESHNGQTYIVRLCEALSAEKPYARELAALTWYGADAVCVELDCRTAFNGDADAVLSAFLDGCHYAADDAR